MDAFIAFARGGDPSCEASGAWPSHVHGSTRCMTFGPSVGVRERARSELDALWSDLI
jgi:hypothetical protein